MTPGPTRLIHQDANFHKAGWSTPTLFSQFNSYICEWCNSPPCRHHHRCKQAEGWRLEQPEPGVLVWHTPAGHTYTATPPSTPPDPPGDQHGFREPAGPVFARFGLPGSASFG